VLDQELGHLPVHYRTPVLLCYLEGKTQEEAARELGWTPTTVRGRLYRGRDLLQRRLMRRGISLGAGLFASLLSQPSASAATALLRKATAKAVVSYTAGKTGAMSAEVVTLAQEALPMIATVKARLGIGVLLAITMVAAGASLLAHQPVSSKDDKTQPNQSKTAANQTRDEKQQPRLDRFGDALPAQAIARLGTVRFRHGAESVRVVYTPDGKLLASSGRDNVIRIWETETGKELHRCVGNTNVPRGLALSPDGKMLVSGSWDETIRVWTIRVWDVASGKELRQWKCKPGLDCLTFSPDG